MKNLSALKNSGFTAIVLGMTAALIAPASQAFGQAPLVSVTVPFDFQDGSQHLKAGRYVVTMPYEQILQLQGTKLSALTLSRPEINVKPSATSKVIFRKYGDQYFLREVWIANRTEHQVLPKTKAEKREQLAQNGMGRDGTEIALLESPR